MSTVEAGLVAAAAAVAGWAGGSAAAALLAHRLDVDAGPVLAHSVVAAWGIGLAAALAAAAALLVVATLRVQLRSLALVDVAAAGGALAILVALARGDASASSLGQGTDAVLLVLPLLVLFVAAVLWARLFRPALAQAGARTHASPAVRVGLLSLGRRAAEPTIAAAFLVVSVGVALFANAYRGTLDAGVRDEATFAVPVDYVLREDLERLVTVQQATASYDTLCTAFGVWRAGGSVAGGPPLTLLALPAGELEHVDGWRGDFSAMPRTELARAIAVPAAGLRGIPLPTGARDVDLSLTVDGERVALALDIRNPRGDFSVVSLGELASGAHDVHVRVPAAASGGTIVALRLALPAVAAFLAGHRESGTTLSVSNSARGTLVLGRLHTGGHELAPFTGWRGTGGVTAAGSRLRYTVNRASQSYFRPVQPLENEALPVVATPAVARTAGPGGILGLDVNGRPLTARVVGVTRFVPSVDGNGVLADRDAVLDSLNARAPGAAVTNEVWIRDARGDAAGRVAEPPFDVLDVQSQDAVRASFRDDPLARGTADVLAATALAALVLTLVALLLTGVSDRRDESGELFELRVQGAAPRFLRRYLRVRLTVVALAGALGGVLSGLVLLRIVGGFVALTAGGTEPVPPLRVTLAWTPLLVGTAVTLVVAAAIVALVTRVRE
jgi:hypothetical protein